MTTGSRGPLVEQAGLGGPCGIEGPVGADLMLGRRDFDAFVGCTMIRATFPIKVLAGRFSGGNVDRRRS